MTAWFHAVRHHLVAMPARTYGEIVVVGLLGLLLAVPITLLALRWLAHLPADHFVRPPSPAKRNGWGWLLLVARNLGGVAVVLLGAVLSLPGVPGPGFLVMFIGLLLLDFPGKRKLELAVLRRKRVRAAIDRARIARGRAPLELP